MVGSLVCAAIASAVGYFSIDYLWRYSVAKQWKARNKK
jgi:hypothetical protein